MSLRISLFGIGYIGSVSAACLARDGHAVTALDVNPEKTSLLSQGLAAIREPGLSELTLSTVRSGRLTVGRSAAAAVRESDISLICVGTPSDAHGALDVSAVERVAQQIGEALGEKPDFHVVVVRSTLAPGVMAARIAPAIEKASGLRAGEGFGLAYQPEFLREGSALADHDHPSLSIIAATDEVSISRLKALQPPGAPSPRVVDFGVAEAIKIAANAWRAVRISFANEVGALLGGLDIDSHAVLEAVQEDPRLAGPSAYFTPGFAFGGSCLPKDLRALTALGRALGLPTPGLSAALEINHGAIDRAADLVEAAGRRSVSLVGLSFKSGTDDLRESPLLMLAERLTLRGHDLRIYDPEVRLGQLGGANLAYLQARLPHVAALLCGSLDAAVRHGETLVLGHAESGAEAMAMADPRTRIIDLVRVRPELRTDGRYVGLCW